MDKAEAKKEILQLIEKLEKLTSSDRKSYTEEETKKDFILPLFKILGWDVDNKKEVTAEEHQSSGRVDYGFYLDSRLKFYLEAKSLGADLHKEEFANQAIRYSWNKGATWAILTDFESIKVFNAQDIERSLGDKLFFEIPYTQFLERFDQLWLLSKESFEENLLDKEAEKVGKKFQKIAVTTLLYKDLDNCRQILTHDLAQWNQGLDKDLLDEGVQKILDRLIFLRVAEDRNIEPPTLIPLIRDWENSGRKKRLYESMVEKFRELDPIYNSGLFSDHPFENWDEYSGATEKVINILYGKKGYYEYDFKAMPADVLGSVYENYLGYCLEKSKKGISIGKDAKKRKDHGIYYTPSFIVDYIVENTLKPVLDKCNSITDLKKIKVLDPACGSGSFLIKALETIYNKYLEFGNNGGVFTKLDILLNNIYGVDLDSQAVEITRLNLLINALDQRMKLPVLDKNIKNGNSLISGTDEELTKYFGKNYRDKKPFNWEEEFPEVFEQGGFDVIIGNPPYVTTKFGKITPEEKNFYLHHFESAYDKIDLYVLFIERAVDVLKNQGFVGFITPWNYLGNFYSFKIRKFLLETVKIKLFNKLSPNIFGDVVTDNIISIFEKGNENKGNQILFDDLSGREKAVYMNQDVYLVNKNFVFSLPKQDSENHVLDKMKKGSIELGQIALNYIGIMTGGQKEMIAKGSIFENSKPVLTGRDISRWIYFNKGFFVNFDKSKIHSNDNEKVYLADKKILLRKTGDHFVACLDKNQFFTIQSLYNIVVKTKDFNEEYLLALLNSKLFTYIYQKFFITNPKVFPYIKRKHLDQLPIKILSVQGQLQFKVLVDKISELTLQLIKVVENSNEWHKLKEEIERFDKKIDEEVYKLYELSEDEIKVVEGEK